MDKTVWLWDGATGMHIPTLEGHSRAIDTIVFSPDGSQLASKSDDQAVRLWDSATGTHIAILEEGHSDDFCTVVFSPDSSQLTSNLILHDTFSLWDSNMGAYIAIPHDQEDPFSPSEPSTNTPMHSQQSWIQHDQASRMAISANVSLGTHKFVNVPICWVPGELNPVSEVFTASSVAIGCKDGCLMILDTRHVHLD